MDFLDPQEAQKINKQQWKQFWWTPYIVTYFQNQRSKTKKFTKPVEIFLVNILKCYSFSETVAYFLSLIVDSSTSYQQKLFTRLQMITLYILPNFEWRDKVSNSQRVSKKLPNMPFSILDFPKNCYFSLYGEKLIIHNI